MGTEGSHKTAGRGLHSVRRGLRHFVGALTWALLTFPFPLETHVLNLFPAPTDDPSVASAPPNAAREGSEASRPKPVNLLAVGHSLPDNETLRHIQRLMQVHFVSQERIQPQELLLAGAGALAKEYPHLLKLPPTETNGPERAAKSLPTPFAPPFPWGLVGLKARRLSPTALPLPQSDLEVHGLLIWEGKPLTCQVEDTAPWPDRVWEDCSKGLLQTASLSLGGNADRLLYLYLKGVFEGLDPHSNYLSADEFRDLKGGTKGRFGGVGLVLDDFFGTPVIREVVPNSAARLAGLLPGDVLLRIGGHSIAFTSSETVSLALKTLTPENPTPVWVYRPSSQRVWKVFLVRDEALVRTVESRPVLGRPDVLHIKVSSFSARTSDEILNLIREKKHLRRHTGTTEPLKMILLDLRNNPGGLLDQAVQVADSFLSNGRIVSMKTRTDEQVEYVSQGPKIDLPLVILQNASSASASEIVAGALKEHGRALVVGERSYGKGSVQSLFELPGQTGLKLTIAHYFTPMGHSLQAKGVLPHVQVRLFRRWGNGIFLWGSSEFEREEDLAVKLERPREMTDKEPDGLRDGVLMPVAELPESRLPEVWAESQENAWENPKPQGSLWDAGWSLSYPNAENRTLDIDPNRDAVVRVALGLADDLWGGNHHGFRLDEESLRSAAMGQARAEWVGHGLQIPPKEDEPLRTSWIKKAFQDSPWNPWTVHALSEKEAPSLIQKATAQLGNCAGVELRLASPESPWTKGGLLGLGIGEGRDGARYWIPIMEGDDSLHLPEDFSTLADILQDNMRFQMPHSFRLADKESEVQEPRLKAYFKPSIQSPQKELGAVFCRLPWGKRTPAPVLSAEVHPLGEVPPGENPALREWSIHLEVMEAPGAPPLQEDNLRLVLFPLLDATIQSDAREAALLRRDTTPRTWVGEVHFRSEGLSAGNRAYSGVVGAALVNPSGHILGTYDLFELERGRPMAVK